MNFSNIIFFTLLKFTNLRKILNLSFESVEIITMSKFKPCFRFLRKTMSLFSIIFD